MKGATLKQASKILDLFADTPAEQIQALLGSGLLTDLRDASVSEVDRFKLRKLCGLRPHSHSLKVWKEIEVGGYSEEDLLVKLEEGGHDVFGAASLHISEAPEFICSPEAKSIALVKASLGQLGFKKSATLSEVLERIRVWGKFCPVEVGPYLRLAMKNQRRGHWAYVVSEPVSTDGESCIFIVGRGEDPEDGGTYLDCIPLTLSHGLPLDRELIFQAAS